MSLVSAIIYCFLLQSALSLITDAPSLVQWSITTLMRFTLAEPFISLNISDFLWGYEDRFSVVAQHLLSMRYDLPFKKFGIMSAVSKVIVGRLLELCTAFYYWSSVIIFCRKMERRGTSLRYIREKMTQVRRELLSVTMERPHSIIGILRNATGTGDLRSTQIPAFSRPSWINVNKCCVISESTVLMGLFTHQPWCTPIRLFMSTPKIFAGKCH